MKASTEFLRRSEFDLTINSSSTIRSSKSRATKIWSGVFQSLLSIFVSQSEPRIWQSLDRTGTMVWHVYDPANGHSACFGSETEVRVWLDQRYYF
jgi:hypothetical protein